MDRSVKVMAVVFAVVFLLSCKQDAEPPGEKPGPAKGAVVGVTDDTILVGQWGPLTGPAALWGAVPRGTQAYFEMINAEGGIHGRKLKLLIRDDAYQPARTKAAVMEMVERKGVFAFVVGVGTGPGMAVKDYLAAKKIPWVGPASGSGRWAHPPTRYLFALYPNYETEAKAVVRYLVDTVGKEKIAFLYQNDDYGKEGLDGAKAELAARGKSLVAEISVEVADQDLSSHVLKLKNANPDVVILWLMPKHAAIALSNGAKLNFKPLWVSSSALSDATLMYKITKGLWEGVIFSAFTELPDSDHPLIKKYHEAYKKFGLPANPQEQWGIFFLAGIVFAEPFVEALRRAGRDLDREKLIDALESLDHWNGGIGHDITFGPNERQGQKSIFICVCKDGKAVKLTDWITVKE